MDLSGATCLVTGAGRGIGAALVEQLAERRVAAILAGVRDPEAYEAPPVPVNGARAIRAVRMDLSSRESIEACCAELGEDLARIDLLVNNAGQMTGGPLEQQDLGAVYAMFQVNLVGVAHLTSRVLPGMRSRRRGKVVNNASISGVAFFPFASTYAASKAGIVALSESLRRELEGTGVSVLHTITPGVRTDMLEATEAVYGEHMDVSGWTSVEPADWAVRVVEAIEADKTVLGPGGRLEGARLLAKGPSLLLDTVSKRMTRREG